MSYNIEKINQIVNGEFLQYSHSDIIDHLLLDSRKAQAAASSLFFALKGPRQDGHRFVEELYHQGIRNFIVSHDVETEHLKGVNVILVTDTLIALQQLTANHREQFSVPVIGITGSNGKTIVKEWLYQLLQTQYKIVRSPKSYNSQIGVPLSVWQMKKHHTMGIFEAGISLPHEMQRLEKIIQPTIGILTNIREAHSEGFPDSYQKLVEKLKLFIHCKQIVYCKDIEVSQPVNIEIDLRSMFRHDVEFYSWSKINAAWLQVTAIEKKLSSTDLIAHHFGKKIAVEIPFIDDASIDNAITCWCTLLMLGLNNEAIAEPFRYLQPVNMRLEMKKGINQCTIINDSYSADLSSLEIALNFIDQQFNSTKKTAILSDFLQSALPDEELYKYILISLKKHKIGRLIAIGERIVAELEKQRLLQADLPALELYWSTEEFIKHFRSSAFKDETILIKGSRIFGFESIVQLLEQKIHQTILEINLNAVAHNLKTYQQMLHPATKMMVMVKAFAYGSGGAEVAGILQYHKADYLAVAYADEGVELRKGGITMPVMVMNPEENSFDVIVENNLEPDLFSFNILQEFDQFIQKEGIQQYPIHVEIETGMNRLGFALEEIDLLGNYLKEAANLKVQSVFTHLASSDDPGDDAFTLQQFERFNVAAEMLQHKLGYYFLKHISNSAAIARLPQLQLGMVRLGIGLYGVDSSGSHKPDLKPVATLKTTIAQLKHLKTGESVSYNRKGIVQRDSVIATVRIGYADGYSRRLGYGNGKMLVNGKLAPVIGTVCMDMTMLDVTDIPGVKEGAEVIVFGKELPVQQVAAWAGTIPYEIMTGISQRVKRVYFEE